ncbi:MAG: inovirus-type Gp2 protein [Formivibrio sp.]|nr:inovirus-type Gp2 protein [Formivibrio sp.]
MTVIKDYTKINEKFDERLEHMIDKHSKVTFFRYDVRFPNDHPHNGKNDEFSEFQTRLKEQLTRHGIENQNIWCREQKTSENPHYHVAALVNGNLTQRVGGILENAKNIWGNIIGSQEPGLINHCGSFNDQNIPYQIRIDRPSSKKEGEKLLEQQAKFESKIKQVRKRAHYLGKDQQKGNVPKGVREYGASELPKVCKR